MSEEIEEKRVVSLLRINKGSIISDTKLIRRIREDAINMVLESLNGSFDAKEAT